MTFTTRQFFKIGVDYDNLANVETLTTGAPNMAPRPTYHAYATTINRGDFGRKALGTPAIIWDWGYIYADMFDALRLLCPGASADLMIRTRLESGDETDASDYDYYTVTAIWPALDAYEYRSGIYQPFQLIFVNPFPYTPPA
jgi:hypothetical protein